jgi:SulP family sulfate permease
MPARAWLPGVDDFHRYRRAWLRGDVVAGFAVAAYLIPQALAYGALAGVGPSVGLWAAVPPLLVYAVLGSSRQLSVGPESTTAAMTAAVLAPLAAGDSVRYAQYAAILAVIVGIACVTAGLLKLGFVSSLLSRPVLVGYLAGIAVVMVLSQIGRLTGDTSVSGIGGQIRLLMSGDMAVHWPTVVLGSSVLAVIVVLAHWLPRWPAPLIGVVGGAAAVAACGLTRYGVEVVGAVPASWGMSIPPVSGESLSALAVPALGIAVVAFSDNVLTARAFAARINADIDADAELRALGVSNLAVGLTGGFPVSSSGSRTALGVAAGARTQLHSLVVCAVVVLTVTLGPALVAAIPSAALGAVIVYAAARLVDVDEFRRLARFRRSEFGLAVATAVAVPAFGVLYGVLAAVALSILDLLRRLARAHDSIEGFVPGVPGMHDVDDYPDATVIPGLLVYRYDAPLCFANAEDFRSRALQAVSNAATPVRWFVLNVEANVEVDSTAISSLDRLRSELTDRGIVFALARVKQDLRDAFRASGLLESIGAERMFMTLPSAVDAYRREQHLPDIASPGTSSEEY